MLTEKHKGQGSENFGSHILYSWTHFCFVSPKGVAD